MEVSEPQGPGGGRRGGLTPAEFEAFLARLAPDRDKAGALYEDIRRRLVRLFALRHYETPEDLADEAIDRVARRLPGMEIRTSPFAYVCGVAHHVAQEMLRQRQRERRAFLVAAALATPSPEPDFDAERRSCLELCLQRLPGDQRRLILDYHQGNDRIHRRQILAHQRGISPNALRIRAHRIRRDLEDCCARCLAGGAASGGTQP